MAIWLNDLKKLREMVLLFIGILSIHFMLSIFQVREDILLALFFIITMVMTFVVSVTNFEYLHDKTKATHIASLPLTKSKLFLIRYSSGLFIIVVPIILYSIVALATGGYSIPILPILLLIGIYYSFACFVGVLAGTGMMHGFLYLIITIVPLLLYVSLFAMFIVFIKGIEEIYLLNSILTYTAPLIRLWYACMENPLSATIIITYSLYIILAIGFGYFVSSKRHLEHSGVAFAFPILENIIKTVIVISFSWIITAVLIVGGSDEWILIVLVYFIVTLLLSIVTQLQRKKSLDIRFIAIQTISICIFSMFVLITSSSVMTTYIPNNIESALLDIDPHNRNFDDIYDDVVDIEGISDIQDIHQYLIGNASKNTNNTNLLDIVKIRYTLTNGDVMYRTYYLPDSIYKNVTQRVVENDTLYTSYMSQYHNLLDVLPTLRSITLYNNNTFSNRSDIDLNQDEINDFQNMLEQELRNNQKRQVQNSNRRFTMALLDENNKLTVINVTMEGPLLNVIERYWK